MHERNIYRKQPDFKYLAEKYAEFAKYVHVGYDGKGHLNFKDPEAVRALTCTLLKEDFNITLEIPLNRLIPTLPLRLNYIHWVEDLVNNGPKIGSVVQGIDIGCGASCIYPLLGCSMNPWHFVALEVDEVSFNYAAKNIDRNNFNDRIILKRGQTERVLKEAFEDTDTFDFCMCNPPFFTDREEAAGKVSRTGKRSQPFSVCTAVDGECMTDGGEVEFVKKMLEESLELKSKIRWYTSMLGKKKSLITLKQYFKDHNVPFVSSTSFEQGRTTRWGICWSFHDVSQTQSLQLSRKKPRIKTSQFKFTISKAEIVNKLDIRTNDSGQTSSVIELVCLEVTRLLNNLEIHFTEKTEPNVTVDGVFDHHFTGKAYRNTWSHQRRKRRHSAKVSRLAAEQVRTLHADFQYAAVNVTDNEPVAVGYHSDINSELCVKTPKLDSEFFQDSNYLEDEASCSTSKLGSNEQKLLISPATDTKTVGTTNELSRPKGKLGFLPDCNRGCNESDFCVSLYQSNNFEDSKNSKKIDKNDSRWSQEKGDANRSLELLEDGECKKIGQKPLSETSNCDSEQSCLFQFCLSVKLNKAEVLCKNYLVEINVACTEGDREGVHQLFTYFKNQFNGS